MAFRTIPPVSCRRVCACDGVSPECLQRSPGSSSLSGFGGDLVEKLSGASWATYYDHHPVRSGPTSYMLILQKRELRTLSTVSRSEMTFVERPEFQSLTLPRSLRACAERANAKMPGRHCRLSLETNHGVGPASDLRSRQGKRWLRQAKPSLTQCRLPAASRCSRSSATAAPRCACCRG
jgi:hypothetical protein